MIGRQANYKYNLGKGITLEAFSIDPALSEGDLVALLSSKDGTAQPDLGIIKRDIPHIGSVNSFDDLEVKLDLGKRYEAPQQLQAYRDAVGRMSDAKGRYNGHVLLFDGPVSFPLRLFQGGYYDFLATKLRAIPHDLVPDQYPVGKTVSELFAEWGTDIEERARYLGFAHLMLTNNGDDVCFVQRAKGMGIAPDCIAVSGSTPNPTLSSDFNFQQYCWEHIRAEMAEEFDLKPSEFQIGGVHLFDDKKEAPFAALEINTPLTTRVLAERIYGNTQAIKEHPVVYSMPKGEVDILLGRFPIFPSTIQIFNRLISPKLV